MIRPVSGDVDKPVRTTCPYCGVGCGILATLKADGSVTIQGDPEHPANFGRLCSKGSALGETVDHEDRLLYPEINGTRASWDQALDHVANAIQSSIRKHGRESVAFYVSGQLLTEDYYVANKLMKGFIGTANIDTNSRLCMASAVAGYKRAFGSDTVPCDYNDLEQADLVVLTGSNTAWCHPVIYQRLVAARKNNPDMYVVNIDPRRTATCDIADLHLPVKSGTDVTLFNGLLNYLRTENAIDDDFINSHTEGFEQALASARDCAPDIETVARDCGLGLQQVKEFFQRFAGTAKTVTLFSQGVNQSSNGTDKVNSIINCHLATGRIGKPGTGPFSITGQPNAMGGREVGGLANQLAVHMSLDNPDHRNYVQRFWDSPFIASQPGPMAVDLFDAVHRGDIKTLWIMATNPVDSLPDADKVREALRSCETVIVSDCIRNTDTVAEADILLPAQAWAEKDGTVTNSERRISRQRKFMSAPGEAKPDWWIISEVAKRLGFALEFAYDEPARIFSEHAALSGYENNNDRDFDISGLADLNMEQYDRLVPVQWPVPAKGKPEHRLFSDGRYFTASGKARFIAVKTSVPGYTTDKDYPLILNTGRVRDQWHTMTRTGKSHRLSQHEPEPCLEIHPADARGSGLVDDDLVRVESRWGSIIVRTRLSREQRKGSVFVPMHWNDQFASSARVDSVVNPVTDPFSGQPESKHTPVKLSAVKTAWEGFLYTRHRLTYPVADYWVCSRKNGFRSYELAGFQPLTDSSSWARQLIPIPSPHAQWLEYTDPCRGHFRAACIIDGRLECCIFLAPKRSTLPARTWLQGLFALQSLDNEQRNAVLAGEPAGGETDTGPVICSCFSVREQTIVNTIIEHDLDDTAEIGEHLRAGTNCGSCLPELKGLIHACRNRTSDAA